MIFAYKLPIDTHIPDYSKVLCICGLGGRAETSYRQCPYQRITISQFVAGLFQGLVVRLLAYVLQVVT